MNFETIRSVESPTGAALAVRQATTVSPPPRGVVIISHGLAEHAARYRPFAEFLAERDYAVYAHDHRGHGATRAPDAPPGRFALRDGGRRVVDDVLAIRNLAASEYPGLPIILFGHSMGGFVAVATAETYPDAFDALAVWNADLHPGLAGAAGRLLLKIERFLKGSDVPSDYGPRFTFRQWANSVPDARSDFDWLSRDAAEVDAYIADPLCGWDPSVSMWLDVIELAATAGASLARLPRTLPIQLLGGGHDPATANGKAVKWLARRLARLGFLNVHMVIHDEMRHETLREYGRDEAMQTFAAWADRVCQQETETP